MSTTVLHSRYSLSSLCIYLPFICASESIQSPARNALRTRNTIEQDCFKRTHSSLKQIVDFNKQERPMFLPKASFFKKSTFPDFSISNACLNSVTRIIPQSMSPTTSVLVMGPPFDNASRMASLKRRWYSSSLAAVSSGMQIEKGTCVQKSKIDERIEQM